MRAIPTILVGLLSLISAVCHADFKQAALAYQRGDFVTAVKELQPLAEQGDSFAQYLLGSALANAKPPLHDLVKAEGWLKQSAAKGNVAAMRDLGQLNMFSKTPDRIAAEKWLREAAERGDAQSQHLLGALYLDAKGSDRRPIDAYKWLILAAMRGHLLSAVILHSAREQFSDEERREGERLAAEWRSAN